MQHQEDVEWNGVVQTILLHLRDKLIIKPLLNNRLCDPSFRVSLPHNWKRHLGNVFQGSWVFTVVHQEGL